MKISALLLTHLLASSANARLFVRERSQEKETKDFDRIINGVEAQEDRYSYTASLQDRQGKEWYEIYLNVIRQHLSYMINASAYFRTLLWSITSCERYCVKCCSLRRWQV